MVPQPYSLQPIAYSLPGLFISGTGTEVGKTHVAAMIARELVAAGRRVGVYKPAASGCRREGDCVVADDAVQLWEAAGRPGDLETVPKLLPLPPGEGGGEGEACTRRPLTLPSPKGRGYADSFLERVCPQRFLAPLAPHRAARAEGRSVDSALLRSGLEYWTAMSEIVLVEGAGGLLSPLGDEDYNIDLAAEFGFPLVIVAANELGVINATLQTVLTARVRAPQLPIAGIVLNQASRRDGDASLASNAEEITGRTAVPLLATLPYGATAFDEDVDWFAVAKSRK